MLLSIKEQQEDRTILPIVFILQKSLILENKHILVGTLDRPKFFFRHEQEKRGTLSRTKMIQEQRRTHIVRLLQDHGLSSGESLAKECNVSLRTIYRDVKVLQQRGILIVSEPGMGFVLKKKVEGILVEVDRF